MLNVLLTGGVGYIGSHTAIVLANAGYNIVLFDNLTNSDRAIFSALKKIVKKKIIFVEGDIRNTILLSKTFSKYKITSVIHFAGLKAVNDSIINPIEYYDNNIYGAISLIKAMKENDIKNLIFSSSATVYGEPKSLPLDELHQTNPINPYGRTKLFVEKFFQDLAVSDSTISITSLRYFNPAGAHESGLVGETAQSNSNNLIPSLLRAIKRQESFKIFGDDYKTPDGTCKRDYIHVMDLADAHLAALIFLETNRGWHLFNIGTGVAYSVLEIIGKFCEVNQIEVTVKKEKRREGDVAISFASPKKANEILKWKSKRSLDDICISAWKSAKV